MDDLGKAFRGFAANALSGRILGYQLRMRRFQALQLLHQAVKFSVGEFRRVQDVIKMFVMADRLAQLVDLALFALVLYSPILYSIVGQAIFGGKCHGLIIFRSADGDSLRLTTSHRPATGRAGTVTCAFADPTFPLVPSRTAKRSRY